MHKASNHEIVVLWPIIWFFKFWKIMVVSTQKQIWCLENYFYDYEELPWQPLGVIDVCNKCPTLVMTIVGHVFIFSIPIEFMKNKKMEPHGFKIYLIFW
jgi:hypothetical protein